MPCFLWGRNRMSVILWTFFLVYNVQKVQWTISLISTAHQTLQTSKGHFADYALEVERKVMFSPSQSVLAAPVAPKLSPVFRFPSVHDMLLISTGWAKEDGGFCILSWTPAGFGSGRWFDQVLWVGGGPSSSLWMSGMFPSKCWNCLCEELALCYKGRDVVAQCEE